MSQIDLPDEVVRLAEAHVAAGRVGSIEEVVRIGVTVLEHRQQRYEEKMEKLRAAIDEGDASPDFDGDPFGTVRAEFGIGPR